MDLTDVKTAGIIGAGVAGLATARVLLSQGVRCTLFERNAVLGGVWADGYVDFGVQAQKELYEYPDWPLPEDTPNFTPGPIIRRYLADYADHFGVTPHIRLNAAVEALEPRDGARSGWLVSYRDGDGSKREEFDLMVVCVGLYSNIPNMPRFPGQERFQGELMHISDLKALAPLTGKRVAVLGFGKSATDAAVASSTVAAETTIIFREAHWPVPRKLAGILPFKWGMLTRLTSTLVPLYQRPSPLERAVHRFGKPLVWLWWRLVELLLIVQCRLGSRFGTRESMVPREPVEIDAFGESTMLPRPEFYPLVRAGKIDPQRTEIAEFTPTGVVLKNGTSLDIDVVVFGTGWRTDYRFLPEPVRAAIGFEDDGFYLYRHMLHPDVPNLAFVGSASTVSSTLTYSLQARWLGELVRGSFRLPARDAMRREIDAMKAWKRSWMPFSHARGARLIIHMQHYHDELLRDFGANPRRKTGVLAPLKELIAPYEPKDYRTIVSGDWDGRETKPIRGAA
ncbi:MAG: FAD-dependent oxidoreductase [Alphaproteobacteria bacterium]|nr:FAD-dependent oxidoreductase [Alphaproteobacteria bacterium]